MLPSVKSIDHIHVFVADRAASEQWYEKVLGFTRVKALEFWSPGGGPLTVQNAQGTVHLALFERPAEKCRSTIALGADPDEFLQWQAHLGVALGRPLKVEDHEVSWSLYFDDPDGNPFEITSYGYSAIKELLLRHDV